ncbi:MAG: sensor histidine kinase [Pseudolabrys sp.]
MLKAKELDQLVEMKRREFIMLLGGVAVAWSLASVALAGSLAAAPLPRSVLIIDQYGPGLPFSAGISSGIRAAVISGSATQVSVYHEQLDLARFRGPVYEHSLNAHFRVKYRDKQVGVIIAVGPAALEYVLRSRAELWPEVPVVFTFVDKPTITQLKLPPDVTGNTLQSHPRDMVTVARTLVPDIKGIALVGDPPENQTYYRDLKKEVPIVAADLEFIDLTGLTMTELRKRVAMLPDHTAILHTSIYSDGEGNSLIPADAVALVAEMANRPIVVDLDTHFGRGTVGGLITTSSSLGEAAAKIALRILNGEIASNIPIEESELAKPIFDWRQLKRFGISEANLPPGSEVRFRELTAWEQYRWQIMLIAAALVIQTTLIIWLYYEHRRRRKAEADSRSAFAKFADMNRIATAGELTASIAHEIKQPLAAMVTNANAGLRWLAKETPDLDETRKAMTNVVSDGHRASEVIGSVQAMFKKDNQAKTTVDLNNVIQDVLGLVRGELQTQGILVQSGLTRPLPLVLGHSGQLQQVILNLVRNAADAMDSVSGRTRALRMKTAIHDPDSVLLSVEDSGAGIAPEDIDRIFESFFTTKSQGMGMGLSICRSIIEAHDGRLWASSSVDHGSVFNIVLPAARPEIE